MVSESSRFPVPFRDLNASPTVLSAFLVPQVPEFTSSLTKDTIQREHSVVRMRCNNQREPQFQQSRIKGRRCFSICKAKRSGSAKDSPSVTGRLPEFEHRGFRSAWTPIASTGNTVTLTAAALHPMGTGTTVASRPKPSGPRPPIDITGPRLPRLVQAVTASRCYNCSTTLPPDTALRRELPEMRNGAALLQTMLPLRAFHALSVHEADPGSYSGEGPGERLYTVFAPRHGGARGFVGANARRPGPCARNKYASAAQCERRPRRLRPALQKVTFSFKKQNPSQLFRP